MMEPQIPDAVQFEPLSDEQRDRVLRQFAIVLESGELRPNENPNSDAGVEVNE